MRRKILYAVLAIFALAAIVASTLRPYAWIRQWRASVAVNGAAQSSARVYRSYAGELLVDLETGSPDLFIVSNGQVRMPNPPNAKFDSVVFYGDAVVHGVDIQFDASKGPQIDPKLVVSPEALRFRIQGDRNVYVKLK
jgi:hypothetical protein